MNYTTLDFVILFVITFFAQHFLKSKTLKLLTLLLSSLIFYLSSGLFDFFIFILVVFVSYFSMVCSRRWPQYKRTSLMVGIGFLLLHLFFWKYAGGIARSIGYDYYLPLPVGISFFTLQGIAYLVDLTDDETPVMSFFEFFLFKSFFCQLIAGPIVRAKEFLPQIQNLLQPNIEQIVEGFLLFSLGLFKKLIIADYMKLFVDVVFADPVKFSRSTLWLGAISFSIQIWGDFSGYTDMGRGCAKMLGIHLPHNFKSHSFSKRPSELWQRWHVTLSRWIKDYIYKPLIKRGKGAGWRTFSILVTFVVVGLWHGATLNFLLYGLFMGGIYLLDKLFQGKLGPSRPSSSPAMVMLVIATVMTYLLNTIGLVFFRSTELSKIYGYMSGLFIERSNSVSLLQSQYSNIWKFVAFVLLEIIFYVNLKDDSKPVCDYLEKRVILPLNMRFPLMYSVSLAAIGMFVIVYSIANRSTSDLLSFIYFQF